MCETAQKSVMVKSMEANTHKHANGAPEVWLIRRTKNGVMTDARAVVIRDDEDYNGMLDANADAMNGTDGAVVQDAVLLARISGEAKAEAWASRVCGLIAMIRRPPSKAPPGEAKSQAAKDARTARAVAESLTGGVITRASVGVICDRIACDDGTVKIVRPGGVEVLELDILARSGDIVHLMPRENDEGLEVGIEKQRGGQ
jgi:hypothetical protein